MKKRTLVCFLIFTLCVFYSSIPDTVFGQDDPSLAQQVYDEYSETLLRDDLQDLVDQVLTALSDPATLQNAKPTIDLLFGGDFGKALDAILASPILIRQVVPDADDSVIALLTNDQDIRAFLEDTDVRTLMQDTEAVKELLGLIDKGAPVDPVDPVDPAPPTISVATSPPVTEQSGSFNVVFATADANKDPVTVTASISVEPADAAKYYSIPSGTLTGSVRVTQAAPTTEMPTIPGATVTLTLTANDGTADSSPATFVLTFATREKPPVVDPPVVDPPVVDPPVVDPPVVDPPDKPPVKPTVKPFDPITSADGKLRLGGLSLNRIGGRQFVAQLIEQALPVGLPLEGDALVDPLVDFILAQVPQGFLPKKQIKQNLFSQQPFSIFQNEAAQLDPENFGNAITPDYLGELIYTVPNETKYLTSDSLHVYARYPSVDIGGVRFSLTGGRTVEGQKVTTEVLQADSIPYTFRLEETLAATNLPAWPALGEGAQLFSSVFLRHSDTGLSGPYATEEMVAIPQEDGSIVWETDRVRPQPGNTHYYFEVKLQEPVTLEILDLQALDEAFSNPGQISVGTKTHTITGWAMPDPRNIQLRDRGIFNALFNDAFRAEIGKVVASPDVIALGLKAAGGEEVSGNEILQAIPPQQLGNLQRLLLDNVEALIEDLQLTFDPKLSSVFSVPKVDLESESIWVANFDGLDENSYYLEALAYDSEGNPLDQIQEDFTVDTSAPKAGINVTPGNNVSHYEDGDVLVVTAPEPGAATLNITATPENLSELGVDKGYIILQMIKLDEHGNPHPEGTWLPLGIESMMLASDIWDEVKGQLSGNPNPIADLASTLPLGGILNLLTVDLIQKNAGPFLKPFGIPELTPELSQELLDLIGAVVEDINLVPLIFDASKGMTMTMPIQGENMGLLVGDYGIRAMGIDNLFNVGSYEPPAMRLKIVPPEFDKAQVTAVSIGDFNDDGDPVPDTPHKTGTIYSNTLDDVTLTVTVTERTEHPATAMGQYMDANGDWQDIGPLDLNGVQEDAMLPIKWANLTDAVFDELIMAGDTVRVRAVATNDLTRGLTPPDAPVEFEIKLDAGLHPPEVLAIMVDPMSITKTNPDSGAPQGTIVINGYTPVLTGPETESVRFEAKRPGDEDWEVIGETTEGMEFTVEVDDLENPIGPPDTYHQWSITVDTATLNEGKGDTITKDSPGARQDYIFNEITNRYEVVDGYVVVDDNKYEVRAVAISMDKLEWSSDARTNFSVDNDDDVAPRGLTHVSVTNLKAFSDSDKVFIDRPVEVAEDGSYTVGGLVDRHDAAVDSPVVTFTITPQAPLGTYELVRLVPLDFPENTVRVEVTETEEVGVFEVAIFDIGTLIDDDELAENDEYVKNGPYMFHALAFDEFGNVQEDMSATDGTLITVNVANTRRPAPGVLAITIDDPTPNPDSGAPSGVITFNGYTPNPTSAPTQKIRFEIKRQDDEEWTLVRIDAGVDKRQDAVEVELEPILPGIDIAKTKDMEHPYPVAWPEMYYRWSVDFDTTFLTDTITADSPAARDHTKDENAYMVRAAAIDGVERYVEGVIANLSIDNIDDVAPLGPTKVEVTSVDAVDSVLEVAEDGSYTVGGLVDKHDDAVNSPVITLTITPTAERRTYDNVRLISTLEGTLISEPMETVVATETAEGSGVFEVTVDIGTLIDNETYLANGPYMFHALAFDENHPFHPEIENVQEDMSDTDGSKITVNVANNRRPAPGVLAITVDPAMVTNPDSEAPQGTITINGYTPDPTSAPMMQVQLEVKRDTDAEWIPVGTAEMSEAAVEAELMPIVADIDAAKAKDMVHPYPVTWPEAYHRWSIEVDTTTLEDSITKDNPGARDVSLDDNPYMVRATAVATDGVERSVEGVTAMFSVDNDDDVAPLGPTNVVATSIDAVDPVFVDNGDGTYTVGGLVDKYDLEVNSPVVTFTITPTAVRKTYASVKLLTTLPEGAIIGDITETAEGSGVFAVTIDVGTLMDDDDFVYNDRYIEDSYFENPEELVYNPKGEVFTFQLHALAYDKAMPYDDVTAADAMFLEYGNIQADDYDGDEITVNVENTYRPDPGVMAISVVNSDGMVNPDSGAPQGELTFNVYTYYLTSPPTEGIRVEVKRPIDGTWERITGTAIDPVEVDVSDVPGIADLDDITGGLVGITQAGTISGEQSEVEIPTRYMKWTFIVDTRELALEDTVTAENTIKLDDTINRGDGDSERDVALDANQYEVRAWSLTPKNENLDQPEYPQRDGVEASFSLDNKDDVPPLGPTNITDIADVAGSIAANEDGSVTVGGIVDPTVPSPIAIFTIQPTAAPITYVGGKIGLVQMAPDGSETRIEGSLEDGQIKIDVGLLENGIYMYHALVADEFGNWQVQGELDRPSPVITVEVLNIRVSDITDLTVTAVDGESPDRHLLQETIGEFQGRFPLKESIAVSFNVNNGSLAVEDLTGVLVDGHEVTFTAGSDAANAFSLMADKLSAVVDGWYTPYGRITKRNGSVTFPLATINLDNTGPMISIETPAEGDTVNDLPTLLAGFGDGDLGSGVSDGSGVSAENTAVVSLARLRPEEIVLDAVPIDVDQSMVEQDIVSVVYTRTDKLAGGAYMFTIQVSDILGNIGERTVTFAVEGINPIVVITAPASGQTLDHSTEEITGFFAGGGDVEITKFTINGEPVDVVESDNEFTYTLPEKDEDADGVLEDGEYTVAVEVTDGSGLTAQTSLTFTVELPVPTVAIHSPHAAQVYDNGKPIIAGDFSGAAPIAVTLSIDGEAVEAVVNDNNQFTYTPTVELSDGAHTVVAEVTDANGRTAKTTTDFTIDIPGPTVMIHVPDAGQMYDISRPVIQGEYSGVAAPVSLSLTLDGEVVPAIVGDNTFDYTPVDALDDGEYTLVAKVTDANGKTAEATAIFSIRLPVPTVVIHSPHAAQVYDNGKPIIAGDFSGAAPIAVTLSIDGETVEAVVNDNNQFTFTPTEELSDGAHTVVAEVTDANGRTAKTSTDFTIDIPGPTVMIHVPDAGQMYDISRPVIQGEYSGVAAPVSLSLTLDGEVVTAHDENNEFAYTPVDALDDGEYTLVAKVTDANGKTAEATAIFSIRLPVPTVTIHSPHAAQVYDNGKPIIAGDFSGAAPIAVTLSIDGEAVEAVVNDNNQFTYTPTVELSDGAHTVVAEVTDANGRTAKTSTDFTIDIPGPTVMIHVPDAGQMYDISRPVIQGEYSGVAAPVSLSLTLDGEVVPAIVGDNTFDYTPVDALDDGEYTLVAKVTDANGKTAEATAIFSIRLPVPTVTIHSPHAAQVYDNGKPIIAGDFSGAEPITVTLSIDEVLVEPVVNDNNQFTYTPAGALSDGAHTVVAEVTDANGRTAKTTTDFTVDISGPTVAILSPAAGQEYEHGKPVVRGEFGGETDLEFTLTLDGEVVPATVVDNTFNYTPDPSLDDGEYTLVAKVTDANSKSVDATVIFSVKLPVPTVAILTPAAGQILDHGKPVITGEFSGADPVEVKLSIDGTVVIVDVNENDQFTYTPAEALSDGEHMIAVMVTDANGRTAETSAVFTVNIPGPSVAIHSPAAGQMYDISKPVITGEFSGVAMPVSLSLTLNGEAVVAEVSGNEFTYTPADALDDGEYTLVAETTDVNGKTAEATAIFSIRLPVPTVAVESPEAGQVYDHGKPVITGAFSGAAPIAVALSIDGEAVEAEVNDNNQFTYTPAEALSDGEHMIAVKVTDANGRTAETSAVFTVNIPGPSVAIHAPAAGQMYDISKPVITGEFSGVAAPVSLSLTLDGEVVVAEVSGNEFTYTPADALDDGEYTLIAEAADANGKTAEATAIFSIRLPVPTVAVESPEAGQVYDHGKPVITGAFSGAAPIAVALSIDGKAVEAEVNDNNQFTYTPAEALSDGEHMIAVMVTDANGRTAETTVVFTVDIPGPSVAIHAPAAGQMYDISKPVITGEFSGVAAPVSLSLTLDGEVVVAEVSGNEFTYTPADALDDGEYTLIAEAADANGKTAEATAIFSIRLPVPTVAVESPEAGQVYDHGKPVITGAFSGAAPIAVALSIDGTAVIVDVNENDQFTYTPAEALSDGEHMIAVMVTDANGRTAETSAVFTVEIPGPSVAIHAPAAGQMYDISKPVITGEFSGVAMPVELSLTLNGEAVVAEVSGNEFTYTPANALDDGEYTLVAEATDANGKTAEATAIFSIRLPVPTASITTPAAGQVYDHGMPIITGEVSGANPVEGVLSIDGKQVLKVRSNDFTYTPTEALSDGAHNVSVEITDANGRKAQASTDFTVDIPGPSVAIHSPAAGQMYDISKPVITGEFSGVAMPVELSLTLNGEAVVAEVSGNEFTYTPANALDDGEYTLIAEAADANGKTAEATAIFSIRLPVPTVAVQTPEAGQVYDHGKPVITGDFSGAAPIAVALSIDGKVVEADVNNNNQFTYIPADALSDGGHTVAVEVTDANGRTAETSAVFTVDIPGPTVAILSPAPGQTYDDGKPVIRVEYSGMTDVEVTTFTINGEDVEVEAEDNQFAYTPANALGTGEYHVVVEVTDENAKTAQAAVVFNVKIDNTPPVISEVSPSGVVKFNQQDVLDEKFGITLSAVITDEQSTISSVQFGVVDFGVTKRPLRSVSAQQVAEGKIEVTESFVPGTHTIRLIATSQGGTTEHSWRLTVEVDKDAPVISSITPAGTIHAGLPTISVSATDESGVSEITIVVMDSNGEVVEGATEDDDEDRTNAGITRLDFNPEAPLSEGSYSIEVRATDTFGNSSTAKGGFSIDFDTAAPIITSSSPQNGARLMYKHDEEARPVISVTFGDAETGVNVDSIRFVIESPKIGGGSQAQPINLSGEQMSATQVIYTPAAPAFPRGFEAPGQYTVTLEVFDNAHQEGNVSDESESARKANKAVYQFTFSVEYSDAPILNKPFNFPNPFKDTTRISFGLTRMSTVSIVVYDTTLRPVRTLRDNVVMPAGNYTGENGIGWDGKTSGGEDLARGIYYCQIIVTDGVESEYAILKLALTR